MLILLFKQIYINLDEYNDADYVNFDMAEEAQWNESEGFENSLCTDPPFPPPSPQEKSEKGRLWFTVANRVCSPRDFPEIVKNYLIGYYSWITTS